MDSTYEVSFIQVLACLTAVFCCELIFFLFNEIDSLAALLTRDDCCRVVRSRGSASVAIFREFS